MKYIIPFFVALTLVALMGNPYAFNPLASTPVIMEAWAEHVVDHKRYKDYSVTDNGDGTFTNTVGLPEYVQDENGNFVPVIIKNRANDIIVVNEQFPIRFHKDTKLIDVYEKPNGYFDENRLNLILNGTIPPPPKFYTDVWSIAYKPANGTWTVVDDPETFSSTHNAFAITDGYQLDIQRTHPKGVLDITYQLLDGKYSKPTVSFTNDITTGFTNTKVVPVNILRNINASQIFNEQGVEILSTIENDTTTRILKSDFDNVNKKYFDFKDARGNSFLADLTLGYDDLLAVEITKDSSDGLVDVVIAFDQVSNIGLGETVTIDPIYSFQSSTYSARIWDNTGGGTTCETTSFNTDTSQFVGFSGGDICYKLYHEFDISSIPDYADVTDTVLQVSADTETGTMTNCDVYQLTTSNAGNTREEIWDDMLAATDLLTNDSFCTTTGVKQVDLTTTADANIETKLQNGDWQVVYGIQGTGETIPAGNNYMEFSVPQLQITYTYAKPTIGTPTASDTAPNEVTVTASGTPNGHGDSILGYYYEKFLSGLEYIPEPIAVGSSPESYFKVDNYGSGKKDTASVQASSTYGEIAVVQLDFDNTLSAITHESDNSDYNVHSGDWQIIAEEVGGSSALIGVSIETFCVSMWKTGSPTGTVTLGVWDSTSSSETPTTTFRTFDASIVPTSSTFMCAEGLSYTISSGDALGFHYEGGDASNRLNADAHSTGSYDGTNSYVSRHNGSVWADLTAHDQTFRYNDIISNQATLSNYGASLIWTHDYSNSTGWTSDGNGDISITGGIADANLIGDPDNTGQSDRIYTNIGTTLSDNGWTIDFDFYYDSSTNANWNVLPLCVQAGTTEAWDFLSQPSVDTVCFQVQLMTGADERYSVTVKDGSTVYISDWSGNVIAGTTQYYGTLARIGDSFYAQLYSDADKTVPLGALVSVTATGVTGLDTLTHQHYPNSIQATGFGSTWDIDNTNIYDGYGVPLDKAGDGENNGATVGVSGIRSNALDFDGTDDYVEIDSSVFSDNMDYSFSVWIQADTTTGNKIILSQMGDDDEQEDVEIRVDDGKIRVYKRTDSTSIDADYLESTQTIPTDGRWVHLVVTYDDSVANDQANLPQGALNLYWNGVLEDDTITDLSYTATGDTNNVLIGGKNTGYFDGSIDDIVIFPHHKLTSSEIQQLYNNGASLNVVSPTVTLYPELTLAAGTEHYDVIDTEPAKDVDQDFTGCTDTECTNEATIWDSGNTSYSYVDTAGDDLYMNTQSGDFDNVATTYDLGETVKDTFVLRVTDYRVIDEGAGDACGGNYHWVGLGSADANVSRDTSQDFVGFMKWYATGQLKNIDWENNVFQGSTYTDGADIYDPVVGTQYNIEVIGTSATKYDVYVYASGDWTTPLGSVIGKDRGTDPLRYIVSSAVYHSSGACSVTSEFDMAQIQFWNGWDGHLSKIGGSVYFDGSTEWESATEELATYECSSGNACTISGWFNPKDPVSGNDHLFSNLSTTGGNHGFEAFISSTADKLYFSLWTDNTNYVSCYTTNAITYNTWQFYTFSYDGTGSACTDLDITINGVSETLIDNGSTGTFSASVPTTTFKLGVNHANGNHYNGQMDEVRFYNTELTSGMVTSLYGYNTLNDNTFVDTTANDGDIYRAFSLSEINLSEPSATVTCAYASGGNSDCNSDAVTPSQPTGLVATSSSESIIGLDWDDAPAADNLTGYKIFRETPVGGGWSTLVNDTASTTSSYSDTGLSTKTQYNYMVAGWNATGLGANSTASADYTWGVPDAVANFSVTLPTVDTLTPDWSAPTTYGYPITGYKIERESPIGGGFSTLVNDTSSTDTSYTDTGLSAVTQYNYRVSAWSSFGIGGTGTGNGTTVTSPPTSLTVNDCYHTCTTQLNLEWVAPSPATGLNGYKIERETPIGGGWSTLVANTSNTLTYYNDTGLTAGQFYNYRTYALTPDGESQVSNTYAYSPHRIPEAVDDLAVTTNSLLQFLLTWSVPDNLYGTLSGYNINYTTPAGDPVTVYITDTGSATTSRTLSGFDPTTEHSFRVSAVTTHGNNATGNIANATLTNEIEIGDITIAVETNPDAQQITYELFSVDSTTDNVQVQFDAALTVDCTVSFRQAGTNTNYTSISETTEGSYVYHNFTVTNAGNDILDFDCWDQTDPTINGQYTLSQFLASSGVGGLSNVPLFSQIANMNNDLYGVGSSFGGIDLMTMLIVIIGMIGFNRTHPALGVGVMTTMLAMAWYFELIPWTSGMLGAVSMVLVLAIGMGLKKRD